LTNCDLGLALHFLQVSCVEDLRETWGCDSYTICGIQRSLL